MVAETEFDEYLAEIRTQVCSRCVERPPGGPPCAPLGKQCGVELHLPALIDSIHEVHSPLIAPYLQHNRHEICEHCALLHSSICPCPMDYLSTLIVEAVESVDRRHEQREQANKLARATAKDQTDMEEICRLYERAAGTWTGCDWFACFGTEHLNLQGMSSARAAALALEKSGKEARAWTDAAQWLTNVERYAAKAEALAALAMKAAKRGAWDEALGHARRAWAWEFATGRPFRHEYPQTWQDFAQAMEGAAQLHRGDVDEAGGD